MRNSHTLFVDEEEAASFSPQDCFDTPAELLGRTYNRPRRSQLNEAAAISGLAEKAADTRKLERWALQMCLWLPIGMLHHSHASGCMCMVHQKKKDADIKAKRAPEVRRKGCIACARHVATIQWFIELLVAGQEAS